MAHWTSLAFNLWISVLLLLFIHGYAFYLPGVAPEDFQMASVALLCLWICIFRWICCLHVRYHVVVLFFFFTFSEIVLDHEDFVVWPNFCAACMWFCVYIYVNMFMFMSMNLYIYICRYALCMFAIMSFIFCRILFWIAVCMWFVYVCVDILSMNLSMNMFVYEFVFMYADMLCECWLLLLLFFP